MDYSQLTLTGIMVILVLCLFGTKVKPAWLFASAIGTSYLAGIINLENMLINFANPSLITLILLVLISIGIEKTSLVRKLSNSLAKGTLSQSVTKLGLSKSEINGRKYWETNVSIN